MTEEGVVDIRASRLDAIATYYTEVDKGDFDAALASFHADAVYERGGQILRGADRIRAYFENERPIAEGRHTVAAIIIDGDQGAAWGDFAGRSHEGSEMAASWCDVFGFDGSLIRRRRSYFA